MASKTATTKKDRATSLADRWRSEDRVTEKEWSKLYTPPKKPAAKKK